MLASVRRNWCFGCSVGQKRRHFGNDSNLSVLNNEKVKHAADNIMILDYNQYVSQYLSMYVCLPCCWPFGVLQLYFVGLPLLRNAIAMNGFLPATILLLSLPLFWLQSCEFILLPSLPVYEIAVCNALRLSVSPVRACNSKSQSHATAVSYTHLTLPTNREV